MEPPTTPPRQLRRRAPRTPPSPTHGGSIDDYEPYRRSNRRTLLNNPYSTANVSASSKVPAVTPKHSARKLSISMSEALSTPPASPAQNTEQLAPLSARPADNGDDCDNTVTVNSSLAPPPHPSLSGMLPTPSKTPSLTPARKRQRAATMEETARILHFRPEDPNDVMPSRRESRKQKSALATNIGDYQLEVPGPSRKTSKSIQIYSDVQSRVPEADDSEANVFVKPRGRGTMSEPEPERVRQWDSSPSPPPRNRKTSQDRADEARMEEAVQRGEGIIYTFRGRKVFRKFNDNHVDDDADASRRQIAVKRAAGEAAERPITRSAIRPRLLWTRAGQEHDLSQQRSYTDEEAETDIDVPSAPKDAQTIPEHDSGVSFTVATPTKKKKARKPLLSPPTTARTTRQTQFESIPSFEDTIDADDEAPSGMATPQRSSRKKKVSINDIPVYDEGSPGPSDEVASARTPARTRTKRTIQLTPIMEDSDEPNSAEKSTTTPSAGRAKPNSPFDKWPRTKSGRKRESDAVEEASTAAPAKRARGGTRSGQT